MLGGNLGNQVDWESLQVWGLHERPVHCENVTDKIHFCRLTIEWRNVRVAKPYEHPNGGNFTFQGPDFLLLTDMIINCWIFLSINFNYEDLRIEEKESEV